jgi:hypothetical protein
VEQEHQVHQVAQVLQALQDKVSLQVVQQIRYYLKLTAQIITPNG